MVAGQSWVGDVLTQERHQQGGRVLLCRRPCREQLRAFTKSSQATASAAPHLNEGEEAQSGADTSHSDGSDSVNHAAPRNSARDSIQGVATRLDFGSTRNTGSVHPDRRGATSTGSVNPDRGASLAWRSHGARADCTRTSRLQALAAQPALSQGPPVPGTRSLTALSREINSVRSLVMFI